MKKQTEYQRAKLFLKKMADIIKREHPQDKPMQKVSAVQWDDSPLFDLYDESGMMIERDFDSMEEVVQYCLDNNLELF